MIFWLRSRPPVRRLSPTTLALSVGVTLATVVLTLAFERTPGGKDL